MKKALWFFVMLMSAILYAQKITERVLDGESVSVITLDTEKIFEVEVTTAPVEFVTVKAWFEGEFTENLFITVTQPDKKHMVIGADFRPLYEKEDDKLAAHKHISVAMNVVLPQNKELIINGGSTVTKISGEYKNLQLYVHDGDCYISNLKGDGKLVTFSGDVEVVGYSGNVDAASDYGKVEVVKDVKDASVLSIHTVKGNISVNKSK